MIYPKLKLMKQLWNSYSLLLFKNTIEASDGRKKHRLNIGGGFADSKIEKKILKLILDGEGNKQMAYKLQRALRTVERHRSNIMHKFGVDNVVDLVKKAGLINLDDSPPIYVVNDAEISIKETTSIENATINTHDSAVATFKTTTSLTAVNLYASGGGQILFPAATSYTGNDYATTTIEASGAGSRINLSALETLVGGGYRGTYRIIKVHCARTAAQAERVILS